MSRHPTRAVLLLSIALLPACLGPSGQEMTASEYAAWEASQRTTELPDVPEPVEAPAADELVERAESLAAEQLDLAHDQASLESERARAVLRQAIDAREQQSEVRRAQQQLATARAARDFFTEVGQGRELDELALDLARAEDSLLEAREELAQLELMYGQDLGEATAEIVLARTRRRLTRAEERVRLTTLAGREVREVDLPARLANLAAEVMDAELALKSAEDRLTLGQLERLAGTAELDHRQASLELRAATLARRAQTLEQDQRAAERGGAGR